MSTKKLVSGTAIMTVLISFVYIAGISFTATETLPAAWAQDKDADEYVDVEEMARDVDDGELDDDHIDYSDFKASLAYQRADHEIQECIDEAEELGDNLADYEVLECTDEYEE